jgi:hypothetical protein
MARIQAYVSDEVTEKINLIVEKRRAEGAREKDVSCSSITAMLIELGLRVYDAQMTRKASDFNQMAYNKILLENVLKTQFAMSKVLGINSLSPHVANIPKFEYRTMVPKIIDDVHEIISGLFPAEELDE